MYEIYNDCKIIFDDKNIYNLKKEISTLCVLFENFNKFVQFYDQLKNDNIVIQSNETQIYIGKKPFQDYNILIGEIVLENENKKSFNVQNFAKKWFI